MVRFSAVSKSFRSARVLDALSLTVAEGERIALVGSNGAGKTTLIRCLLGEYVHEGSIEVDGIDPRRDRAGVLGRIGFVPQLPPPLRMPVGELIRFATRIAATPEQRVTAIASALGLDAAAIALRPFVRLSGGQKQKLLIAIALGRDTRLLVMDEPAANLDPPARKTFFELLAGRRDVAMIITSHRLDEVAPLVNRVVELDGGRVVLDDRVEDSVALDSRLVASLRIERPEPAFAQVMREWRFDQADGGLEWTGAVAGPDRLRFLALLTRYAGLLANVRLDRRNGEGKNGTPR